MRYHKKQPPVERTCMQCVKTFLTWASLLRHGKRCDFCSRSCWELFSRVTVVCDTCATVFSRQKALVSRYGGKNFCSRKCTALARRTNPNRILSKRLRYGSPAFRQARKQILERDGMCQICSDTNANSVHHKNWKPYDNSLENLVLLCRSCHGKFKRFEDWDTGRNRIVACSDLRGDTQSTSEMQVLNTEGVDNKNEDRLEICFQVSYHESKLAQTCT